MSGQVRWRERFIKNKTLDYKVRRNSGLVEARQIKDSAGNLTYASNLVLCVCFKQHKYRHFSNFSTRAFNYCKLKCGECLCIAHV